jgi:hypothetical protein
MACELHNSEFGKILEVVNASRVWGCLPTLLGTYLKMDPLATRNGLFSCVLSMGIRNVQLDARCTTRSSCLRLSPHSRS